MSAAARTLRPDADPVDADLAYLSLSRSGDGRAFATALAVAVLIHVVILLINFPRLAVIYEPPEKPEPPTLGRYIPPPPPVERPRIERARSERLMPIPDPTPAAPEPIREPERPVIDSALPEEIEVLFGEEELPPSTEPRIPGFDGVTDPELIPESKVQPVYPEMGRVVGAEARVTLQAIVRADGSVGEIRILSCTRPHLGFEESAVEAVRQWRYLPGTQRGVPVDVYFTVYVTFTLH